MLDECHQGVPPALYDIGLNMDCCTDPEGSSCTGTYTGLATAPDSEILTGVEIYENGVNYVDGTNATASTSTSTAHSSQLPLSILFPVLYGPSSSSNQSSLCECRGTFKNVD